MKEKKIVIVEKQFPRKKFGRFFLCSDGGGLIYWAGEKEIFQRKQYRSRLATFQSKKLAKEKAKSWHLNFFKVKTIKVNKGAAEYESYV